jgi:hypothetical protein
MIKYTYHVPELNKFLQILFGDASCPSGQSDYLPLKPSRELKVTDNEQRPVFVMKLLPE